MRKCDFGRWSSGTARAAQGPVSRKASGTGALIGSLPVSRNSNPVPKRDIGGSMAEPEPRLLMLIDDEPAQCRLITAPASRYGWRTLVVKDSETAIATLGTREGMQLSAIVLDQWVPGDGACALIAALKRRRPALPILMLTTSASPLLAVEAMRDGATEYLVKPVAPDRLMQALRNATTRETPKDALSHLSEKLGAPLDFASMVGTAP